jgi:glycerophosphoryl diester phosphodiesterase
MVLMGGCMTFAPPDPDPDPIPVSRIETSSGAIRPLMIAHRCGSGLGPENTCYAVVQSSFYRPDYYEIDLRHTSDGVPVCMHDSTLDRTTDLTGNVSELTWKDLQNTDAGAWFASTASGEQIPTLETMQDCVNPSPLAIEIKEPEITLQQCNHIADLLNSRDDESSVILSFHISALETFKEADPERRTCYLTVEMNEYSLNGPHEIIGLLATQCTEEIVGQIHDAGKAVWVWTVNDNFETYIQMRDDGITSDFPDRLRSALPPS